MLLASAGYAQMGDFSPDKNSNWQDRIYFGGGFGLSGGSWGTSIQLSPIVGYMITSRLSAGVGVSYEYYKFGNFDDNRWGGSVFMRVNLFKQIFAYGRYEFLNYSYNYDKNNRRMIDRLPLGLGLSQPLGRRSSLNFLAAYDVLHEDNGPYGSPWIFSVFFSL